MITGLPKDDWSETDIENLVQPFGTPSGMVLAMQIGKVCSERDRLLRRFGSLHFGSAVVCEFLVQRDAY